MENSTKCFAPQKFAYSYTDDEAAPPPRCPSFERAEGNSLAMPSFSGVSVHIILHQLCPTHMAYWTANCVAISTKAAYWVIYQWGPHIEWLALISANSILLTLMYWMRSNPNCNGNRRVKVALRTASIKNVIQNYQRKNWLSVGRILSLQPKPKLGRTKPSTGPHVGRESDIADALSLLAVVGYNVSL